ncbi:MAG: DinB family protein [Duganella sp.]
MNLPQIQHQLRYKQWADSRTLAATGLIDVAQFPSEMAFACQQLNHMIRVEEVFKARLLCAPEPHTTSNSDPGLVPPLQELVQRVSASNAWLQAYAQSLSGVALAETIRFRFLDGQQGALTREEVLFHLVNHGTYHRGAIGHVLDLAGNLRPADTYTVFIHADQPERRDD